MPEISDAVTDSGPEMSSLLENLQKHKLNTTTRQNVVNSSTSSIKETSSSSTSSSQQASFFKRKTKTHNLLYNSRKSCKKWKFPETHGHSPLLFLRFVFLKFNETLFYAFKTRYSKCSNFAQNEKPQYFVHRQLKIDANLSQYFILTDVYVECNVYIECCAYTFVLA